MIESNLVHGAYQAGIRHLMFLGSSCIYPRDCPQPIKEEYLLTGPLEPTNEPYAIAKIAGIKLCENYNRQYQTNYIALMPTNLYGPGDNYDLSSSHVLPALIRKAHEGKRRAEAAMTVWGSGRPFREFLHVDDLAAACVFFMHKSLDQARHGEAPLPLLNIGTGQDLTIRALAELVLRVVGSAVKLTFDETKPDGTPKKLLDVSRAGELGWVAKIRLEDGIRSAYQDFLSQVS
jgi:GDP-L-fucose synthase